MRRYEMSQWFGEGTWAQADGDGSIRVSGTGTAPVAYAPHPEWRSRCTACDYPVPLYVADEGDFNGIWVCEHCGAAGRDDVFKCGSCGERWGGSAAGESDTRLCGYCDGTFLWEPCPACGNQGGGELKTAGGPYRCLECGAEFLDDGDGDPVPVGGMRP